MPLPTPLPPPPPPPNRTPASASPPPPASASPSVAFPLPDESGEADELAALNPFEVMRKHAGAPPASPPPPPASPPPVPTPSPVQPSGYQGGASPAQDASIDQASLIRQAAVAPAETFILPPVQAPPQAPPAPSAAVAATPVLWKPETTEQKAEQITGVRSGSRTETGEVPKIGSMADGKAVAPAEFPVVPGLPTDEASTPAGGDHHRPVGLIALLGAVIALGIVAASGYFLAASGTRVPLFYAWVSGLQPKGTDVAKTALALVGASKNYQENGTTTITQSADGSKPSLPASGDQAIVPIASLKGASGADEPLTYRIANKTLAGKLALTLGSTSGVPVYYATDQQAGDGTWTLYLPALSQPATVRTKAAAVKQTLLYPLFQPVSLPQILAAVQSEKSYSSGKVAGSSVAQYVYQVDAAALASSLPEGAVPSAASAQVNYAWKTGRPLASSLQFSFTYQGKTYQAAENWDYAQWDVSDTALAANQNVSKVIGTPDPSVSVLSLSDFISQLGVVSLDALPHTASAEAAAPAVVAIEPSGEGVTDVQDPITVVPPLPESPASDQAKQRDTQRLSDLADLQKALEAYKNATGAYPVAPTIQQTRDSQILLKALVPVYITKLPVDPLPTTYWYEYQSTDGSSYFLRSVAENALSSKANKGKLYYYYELTNN